MATVFPFALLNYVLAVTPVSTGTYAMATAAGLAPGIWLYVRTAIS